MLSRIWYRLKLLVWWFEAKWQRLTRGYSDWDIWSLDDTIAKFVLPRLKAFREMKRMGVPIKDYSTATDDDAFTEDEWNKILDKMIYAFDICVNQFEDRLYVKDFDKQVKQSKDCQEGLDLFGKHFRDLWD